MLKAPYMQDKKWKYKDIEEETRKQESLKYDNLSAQKLNVEHIILNFSVSDLNRPLILPNPPFKLDSIKYEPKNEITYADSIPNLCFTKQIFRSITQSFNKKWHGLNRDLSNLMIFKCDIINDPEFLVSYKNIKNNQKLENMHSLISSNKKYDLNLEDQENFLFNKFCPDKDYLIEINSSVKREISKGIKEYVIECKKSDNSFKKNSVNVISTCEKDECLATRAQDTINILFEREDFNKLGVFLTITDEYRQSFFFYILRELKNGNEAFSFLINKSISNDIRCCSEIQRILSNVFCGFITNCSRVNIYDMHNPKNAANFFNLFSNFMSKVIITENLHTAIQMSYVNSEIEKLPTLGSCNFGTFKVELLTKEMEHFYINNCDRKKYEISNYEKYGFQRKRKWNMESISPIGSLFYERELKKIKSSVNSCSYFRMTNITEKNSIELHTVKENFLVSINDGSKHKRNIPTNIFKALNSFDYLKYFLKMKNVHEDDNKMFEIHHQILKSNEIQLLNQNRPLGISKVSNDCQSGNLMNKINKKTNNLIKFYLESMERNKSLNPRIQSYFDVYGLNLKRKYRFSVENNCDHFIQNSLKRKSTCYLNSKNIKREALKSQYLTGNYSSSGKLIENDNEKGMSSLTSKHEKVFEKKMSKILFDVDVSNIASKNASNDLKVLLKKSQKEESDEIYLENLQKKLYEIPSHCSQNKDNNSVERSKDIVNCTPSVHETILDSFYKIKTFDFPWKNKCIKHPLLVSDKKNIDGEPSCSGIYMQHLDESKDNYVSASNNRVRNNQNDEINHENLSDENEIFGDILISSKNKDHNNLNENNKMMIPDVTTLKSYSVREKRDICCQTDISLNTLLRSEFLNSESDTVIQNSLKISLQNTESKTDLINEDYIKRGKRKVLMNSIDNNNCRLISYCDSNSDEIDPREESDTSIDDRKEREHVVPYNEKCKRSSRSKVRLGLSIKKKAESLHPYLRRRRDWFF